MNIQQLREQTHKIVSLGSHPGIIQSILDYDYLIHRDMPSVIAIVAKNRKQERFFWGETEISIPVVNSIQSLSDSKRNECSAILNVQSARRVLRSTLEALEGFPNVKLVTIFAEQTPESHTLKLIDEAKKRKVIVTGPSSVGVLIPGALKLGAIGGTQHEQLSAAGIFDPGDTAVVSTSGGIVNELIHTVTKSGLGVSFAMAIGGDRYPATSPIDAIMLAQNDTATNRVVYFGELGGVDEYEIARYIKEGLITKELIVYIAGTVAELFENPPQFGHAKALAQVHDESASAKKTVLRDAGAIVCETFGDIANVLESKVRTPHSHTENKIGDRKKSMIVSHISGDIAGEVQLIGGSLLSVANRNSIASLVLSMLLGKQIKSDKAENFIDFILKLLVDHGPYVSGALNTIVSARAGKDLVSSLVSGLLTVGPRFGGAINEAAAGWLSGVSGDVSPGKFIESFGEKGGVISGIGHKKYRSDFPDPRVEALLKFSGNTNGDRYLNFALSIEKLTIAKKSNLILNVDGVIAALLLDILESELDYSTEELKDLIDIEFFNALFVLSRSVGFTAHYLDQKRHDEGLLRLSNDDIRYIP